MPPGNDIESVTASSHMTKLCMLNAEAKQWKHFVYYAADLWNKCCRMQQQKTPQCQSKYFEDFRNEKMCQTVVFSLFNGLVWRLKKPKYLRKQKWNCQLFHCSAVCCCCYLRRADRICVLSWYWLLVFQWDVNIQIRWQACTSREARQLYMHPFSWTKASMYFRMH